MHGIFFELAHISDKKPADHYARLVFYYFGFITSFADYATADSTAHTISRRILWKMDLFLR